MCSRNITETFENYSENFRNKFLKISRIIAENFEIYFTKFQMISRNTLDIFGKYFSENFESISKNIENYSGNFR